VPPVDVRCVYPFLDSKAVDGNDAELQAGWTLNVGGRWGWGGGG